MRSDLDRSTESTVLVLGAGFSRAVSDTMPLTDELGDLILARLRDTGLRAPASSFSDGYFEAWLSRFAEDQPDLRVDENLLNRYWFARITTALQETLVDRETNALQDEAPSWLLRLLGLMHSQRMTAISFNYDTLVEHAVATHLLFDWKQRLRASWHDVVDHLPPLPAQPTRFGGPSARTFLLLKLHGSTNTYWVPGDTSGATIHRWDLFGGWGTPELVDRERRQRELPGREPFVVPPAASKSAYYRNPITREVWNRAATALEAADRLILLGYSLPITDLVTTGMLSRHVARTDVKLDVVDLCPLPVKERLRRLGVVDDERIRVHDGARAIQDFVLDLEGEASLRTTQALEEACDGPDVPLLVAWSEACGAAVVDVRRRNHGGSAHVELVIEATSTLETATRARHGTQPVPVRTQALIDYLIQGVDLLSAVLPDGERITLVDHESWRTNVGYGDGRWRVLVPATAPPRGPV